MRLKYGKAQIVLEFIVLFAIIAMFVYTIAIYKTAPDRIPNHYGASGAADSWSGKSVLFMLPCITVIMYILISAISLFPTIWNMPVKVTDGNRNKLYSTVRTMIVLLKLDLVGTFFYLQYNMSRAKDLPGTFIYFSLTLLFALIVFFVLYTIYIGKKYS